MCENQDVSVHDLFDIRSQQASGGDSSACGSPIQPRWTDALQAIDQIDYSPGREFELNTQLRQAGFDASTRAEIFTQAQLRVQAQEKFGDLASRMIFTRTGLEQATRHSIAQQHATHFATHGIHHVLEYGCGIGADSLAFARAGLQVSAIEIDEDTAMAAAYNVRSFPNAQVIHADASTLVSNTLLSSGDAPNLAHSSAVPPAVLRWDAATRRIQRFPLQNFSPAPSEADALWLDPARRTNGRRLQSPEDWQPPLSTAIILGEYFQAAGIKVAPGIDYRHLPPHAFVQWISQRRELAEAVLWLGSAAPAPGRQAVIIAPHSSDAREFPPLPSRLDNAARDAAGSYSACCQPNDPAPYVEPGELQRFIIDPDPAIVRSGALAAYAQQQRFHTVSANIAYLTGDHPASREFGQSFTVLTTFPLNPKQIGKELRARGVTAVEIKKRGVDISPETFRKQLKLGSSAAMYRQRAEHTSAPAAPALPSDIAPSERASSQSAHTRMNRPEPEHWPSTVTLIMTPLLGKRRAVLAVSAAPAS